MAEEVKNEATKADASNEQPKVIQPVGAITVTPPSQPVDAVTVTAISTQELPVNAHPNDVVFVVKYSKDFKGERAMKEGPVVLSKELAEQFTQLGIGKVQA